MGSSKVASYIKTQGADKMKKKLLTVLMISAMILTGSTVSKADDVFESNTEANPEDVISKSRRCNKHSRRDYRGRF